MRRLTFFVLTIAALYSGYWFIGRRAVVDGTLAAMEQLHERGWDIQYSAFSTRGFPNRFDTEVMNLQISDPINAFGWSAPLVRVFALSYRPNEIIAIFPETQTITLPDQTLDIISDRLRASAAVAASISLPLQNITLETVALEVNSSNGLSLSVETGLFAMRDAEGDANQYDVFLELNQFLAPLLATDEILSSFDLPESIDRLRIELGITTNQPIDRHLGENDPLALTAIRIREGAINWGDIAIDLTGELTIDPAGMPDGSLTLILTNWHETLEVLQVAGFLDAETGQMVSAAARSLSGDTDILTLPITIDSGVVRMMGLISLGNIRF